MRSDWKEVYLGDVSDIRRGSSPRPIKDFISKKGMPWVKIADATESNGRFISSTKEFIKEEGVSSSVIVNKGDLILSNSGTAGLPKFMGIKACIHDGWQTFTNLKGINKEFLYYTLINVRRKLLHNAYDNIMKNLTLDMVKELVINIPSIETQKKIANILSILDDKIELNHKMNQTLEDIAQALFKSWFVDFDPVHAKANASRDADYDQIAKELGISREVLDLFPDEFEESELGMIPKGWDVKEFGQIGSVVTGKTPSTKNLENYGNKYQFITIPDMHNQIYITSTERYLSETGHLQQVNKLIPMNSLVISCIATVGLVSINTEESHTNQQINSIVCDKKHLYYLYCMLSSMTDQLKMYGSAGTATLNVNKSTFEGIKALLPSNNELQVYLNTVAPMFEQMLTNTKQIQILQKTRDTLLPKLLSGELDVSELELDHVAH